MDVLFVLIPVSIALATASVVACVVAIRGGQYDDLESPRWRMLFDERRATAPAGAAAKAAAGDPRPPGGSKENVKDMKKLENEHTGAQARRSNPL